MQVFFRGTNVLPTFHIPGSDRKMLHFDKTGEYEIEDVMGKELIKKRPEMFGVNKQAFFKANRRVVVAPVKKEKKIDKAKTAKSKAGKATGK